MNSRRSWLIFAVGVFGYLVAVMQRTTIGVAGVAATERFHSTASVLSTLAVVQLIVYAAMQIPVGVLIDRVGSRWLMTVGTALMIAGQVTVALAPTIGIAVIGRILVGAGDATIFTSLIRLTSSWFTGRLVPQLSQWIGNIGQLGQVLSAIPFALILHQSGWTTAFLSAASLSVVALVGIVAFIPTGRSALVRGRGPASWAESLRLLRVSLQRPGTQLGFWSHFVTQSSGTVFSLMWGFPFMVYGLGIDPAEAAGLLIVMVVAGLISGPILGLLTARFPLRRSNLVLGDRRDDGPRVGDRAALAGHAAVLAAHPASGRHRDRGTGVAHRFRLRPHLQPAAQPRIGERNRQRRRIPREFRDDVPDRRGARCRELAAHRGRASRPISTRSTPSGGRSRSSTSSSASASSSSSAPAGARAAGSSQEEGIEVAPLWVALTEAWRRRRREA